MRKKILLIGFQKYNAAMYPHLRSFIDEMKLKCDLTYFYYRERGYFFENFNLGFNLKRYFSILLSVAFVVIDTCKLYRQHNKLRTSYDAVIAIDYFIYSILSAIFRGNDIVLWSHDLISSDHPFNNNLVFKFIYLKFAQALCKFRRIIIQSEERAKLLLDHIKADVGDFDIFYMPVCLADITIKSIELSSKARPMLMQCGGIGSYRLSDQLIDHFQENFEFYRLYFHGRIFKEMRELLHKARVLPVISERMIPAENLHQIVDCCDIGFVGYEVMDANFQCIAMASGQMTEFVRMAKPLIVMGKTNLGNFVEDHGIGISIKEIGELNGAIEVIRNNYLIYSNNSRACFDKYFKTSLYIDNLLDWL